MKKIQTVLALVLLAFLFGCVNMPTKSAMITYSPTIKSGDVIEASIDVARTMGFPPATKIDKANGLVEFGDFGRPVIGFTAQVRIKTEAEIEVNVTRGSGYIPLGVDKQADEFRSKLEEKLKTLAKPSL